MGAIFLDVMDDEIEELWRAHDRSDPAEDKALRLAQKTIKDREAAMKR